MALIYSWACTANIYKNFSPDEIIYIAQNSGYNLANYSNSGYVELPPLSSISTSRPGYTLVGYSQDSNASTPSLYGGDTLWWTQDGDWSHTFEVYCIWQIDTYTVSYNANGGTGAPSAQTKTYGTALTLSSTVPTRTNYIFKGWATSSTGAVVYQPGDAYTANESVTLCAIWAVAAGVLNTVTDTNIGSSGTATWTKISEAHTYKLVLSCSNAPNVTVDNIAAGTSSASFTIPATWYSALPNSTSGTATAVLYSYNAGELVGSTSKSFTVSVAASIKPTISAFTATPHSANQTVDGWGVAVQGLSYLTLAVTAQAGASASIANVSFTGPSIAQSSAAASGDTAVITATGTLTYTVTVTDSRGRTATDTVDATSYEYSNPIVHSLAVVRCMSDGTASDTEGDYLKALPVFVYSSVNGNNSLSVKKIEYKEHDVATWTVGIASAVSGSWSAVFGPADITKAFDVKITITDALSNTYALEVKVQSVVGFAVGLKNDRARFGGPVRIPGLEIDWDTLLHGNLTMGTTTLTEAQLQALLALI